MSLKDLRYNIMLALYFPILLYAFSTFDLSEETYAVQRLEPVVVGEPTVVLGQPFTARAFLAVGEGQGQRLEGADALEVVGDSLFQMETSTLLAAGEDLKTVSYEGTFQFQQIGGAVAEIPVQGSFNVRRPEIVATSEATQTLYRQCRNTVRIEVPGLEDRALKLQSGGQQITGRAITLSPGGDEAAVSVYLADAGSGDVLLGTKRFSVIDPPRPEIQVQNAGREIKNGDNLPLKRALLEFAVQPDEEFKRRYPDDARYQIRRARVFLRKGQAASKEIGTFDLEGGNRLVLTRALRDARPGDRILIQLEDVVRVNHAGTPVAVPLSEATRTFGFVTS